MRFGNLAGFLVGLAMASNLLSTGESLSQQESILDAQAQLHEIQLVLDAATNVHPTNATDQSNAKASAGTPEGATSDSASKSDVTNGASSPSTPLTGSGANSAITQLLEIKQELQKELTELERAEFEDQVEALDSSADKFVQKLHNELENAERETEAPEEDPNEPANDNVDPNEPANDNAVLEAAETGNESTGDVSNEDTSNASVDVPANDNAEASTPANDNDVSDDVDV
jgi:hypothetical protein